MTQTQRDRESTDARYIMDGATFQHLGEWALRWASVVQEVRKLGGPRTVEWAQVVMMIFVPLALVAAIALFLASGAGLL